MNPATRIGARAGEPRFHDSLLVALRFLRNLARFELALLVFCIGTVAGSTNDAPSGLSAHITPATNRVSTLSLLEFSVVVTNSGATNVTIHPWILKNGLGTVEIFNSQGLIMAYHPVLHKTSKLRILAWFDAQPPHDPRDLVLMPGDSYAFKYTLGERFVLAITPGKYHARGDIIPSNDVEITVE